MTRPVVDSYERTWPRDMIEFLNDQRLKAEEANQRICNLFIADFNHDGKPDLLIGFNTNGGWILSGDELELALGNGDGTFQNPRTFMAAFGPVAVGDLNHDGYLDLVQLHDPGQCITAGAVDDQGPYLAPAAIVYLGQANGQSTKGATYLAPQVQYGSFSPALLGDFDGDGNLDIAIPYGTVYSRPWSFRLLILGGVGDGRFRPSGIPYDLPGGASRLREEARTKSFFGKRCTSQEFVDLIAQDVPGHYRHSMLLRPSGAYRQMQDRNYRLELFAIT